MTEPIRFSAGKPFSRFFLGLDARLPTGAVVRRHAETATVVAPLSPLALIVKTEGGETAHWPVVDDAGIPVELVSLPDLQPMHARRAGVYAAGPFDILDVLLHAPASFFVQLHAKNWRLQLAPVDARTALEEQFLHFCPLSATDLVHYLEFDKAAVLDWLKKFRKVAWAEVVCALAEVTISDAQRTDVRTDDGGGYEWSQGQDRTAKGWFPTKTQAVLGAAEVVAPGVGL